MAVLLLAAFWIILAIGLVFIALSGGPSGARERLHGQSRGGRRAAFIVFAVIAVVFGVALPVAASIGVSDRDSVPESNIASLTAQEQRGRELFAEHCKLCHTLDAAGSVATVGPNLDELGPTQALVLDAIHNGRARGNGAMARDLVVGEDAEAVAAFIAKAVGTADK